MNNDKSVAIDYGLILLTALLVFVCVPGYMISITPDEYKFIDSSLLMKAGIFLLTGYFITVSLFYWASDRIGLKRIAQRLMHFIFFWVTMAGFLIPLALKSKAVDPFEAVTPKVNFFLVLFLSIFLTVVVHTKLRKYVIVFFSVFLIITILSATPGVYGYFSGSHKPLEPISKLSKMKNIIVLSLDGVPGLFANQLIMEDIEYKRYFKDFIVFENALSTNVSTQDSMRSELYGVHDFTKMDIEKLPTDHLPMNQKGLDVYTYGLYNYFNNDHYKEYNDGELRTKTFGIDKRAKDVFTFFRFVAVRLGTHRVLNVLDRPGEIMLKTVLTGLSDVKEKEENELVLRLKNHKGDKWDENAILTILDLESFRQNLSVGDSNLALRYLHFNFTHFPVDFDENSKYKSDDASWFRRNQNARGVKNETRGALRQLAFFLDRLKELGIYDQSLIVFKSDHGKPLPYYSSTPSSFRINGHSLWGYGRYRPMLMIKDVSAKNTSPVVNDNLVLLSDLANTLCRSSKADLDCDKFPGVDLLSGNFPKDSLFYMFVPKNAESDFMMRSHKSVKLSRNKDLVQSMLDSKEIELTENYEKDWKGLSTVLDRGMGSKGSWSKDAGFETFPGGD